MNARQRGRRDTQPDLPGPAPASLHGAERAAAGLAPDEPPVSGPAGPGGYADFPGPAAAGAWSRPSGDTAGPGSSTDEPELLVSDGEVDEIRWAGYKTAMADAEAHLDRSLAAAVDRLDKVTHGAYVEYGRDLERAFTTHAAARRAAMHAHELAQERQQ